MAFTYTKTQAVSDINRRIFGKIGMIASQDDFINDVARDLLNDVTIRSTKRRTSLTPNLFPEIYQYALPTDIKDSKITDIPAQAKRFDDSFRLVPVEQFSTNKQLGDIAIDSYNGVRTLLINSQVPATQQTIAELDSLTSGGGTWASFGDAENLERDGGDYIKGAGSVSFDINASGGTTAGIVNSGLNTIDLTNFLGGDSAVFVWHRINSTTGITSYTLHLGTDASNYYSKTATVKHDNNAFEAGWNLLRFDLTNLTETGTVTDNTINYAAVYMNKSVSKVSETDYKFDWLVISKGYRHDVDYYSKYPWQSNTGTWKIRSTSGDDLLNFDDSEYDLFLLKGKIMGLEETNGDISLIDRTKKEYTVKLESYGSMNPDESQLMTYTYQNQ